MREMKRVVEKMREKTKKKGREKTKKKGREKRKKKGRERQHFLCIYLMSLELAVSNRQIAPDSGPQSRPTRIRLFLNISFHSHNIS